MASRRRKLRDKSQIMHLEMFIEHLKIYFHKKLPQSDSKE